MIGLTALIIVVLAVAGSSAVTAILAWLFFRTRGLESAEGSRKLAAEVERLRDELLATRDEVDRLAERVDFTEKLLTPPEEPGETAR